MGHDRPEVFTIGDLVVFLQTLEWDDSFAAEGEVGIVIGIFAPDDEINFFDLQIQLADGTLIPVWIQEVEILNHA